MTADVTNQAANTLRILGRDNSFNVRKVLWACEELGAVSYTHLTLPTILRV